MNIENLLEQYQAQENMHSFEGRRGVIALAKIVKAIGYNNSHDGNLGKSGAYLGNIVDFLEDNPGAIEALVEFVIKYGDDADDWKENLKSNIDDIIEEDEEEDEDE